MKCFWIINRDCFNKPTASYNRVGAHSHLFGFKSIEAALGPIRDRVIFRMATDDNDIMFYGIANIESFDPLDDLGTPDMGCTIIQFKTNGEWITL